MTFDAFALRPLSIDLLSIDLQSIELQSIDLRSIDLRSIELYPGLSPRSSPVVVLRCP